MPSPDRQQSDMQETQVRHSGPTGERSATPPRPSYSPVTPTIPQAFPVDVENPTRLPPEWIDEPEPLSLNLEDNSDAIALRAAISILQLQREQSLRDIRALDKMKAAALREPESFIDDLKAGKLSKSVPAGITNLDDSEDEMVEDPVGNDEVSSTKSNFGTFPTPQNIVRSPPINWDKYHVIGESLDKLHEQQRRRPGSGEFSIEPGNQQPEHVVAAPYRAFLDKLDRPATPTPHGNTTIPE